MMHIKRAFHKRILTVGQVFNKCLWLKTETQKHPSILITLILVFIKSDWLMCQLRLDEILVPSVPMWTQDTFKTRKSLTEVDSTMIVFSFLFHRTAGKLLFDSEMCIISLRWYSATLGGDCLLSCLLSGIIRAGGCGRGLMAATRLNVSI